MQRQDKNQLFRILLMYHRWVSWIGEEVKMAISQVNASFTFPTVIAALFNLIKFLTHVSRRFGALFEQ